MDPQNQPQFNPKIPISEVLKQEQDGYVPTAPVAPKIPTPTNATFTDEVVTKEESYSDINGLRAINPASGKVPVGPLIKDETPIIPAASKIQIIKTYRSDAADATRVVHASMSKLVIADEQQRRERGEEVGATPKKHTGLLIGALVLIALGAASIPVVQYILNQKKVEVPIAIEKSIIPFDHLENITLEKPNRENFLAALDVLSKKQTTPSSIEYVKIFEKFQDADNKTVTQTITPDVFAGLIGPNMPSALARSFDSYMYGIEDTTNPKPFIMVKTSAYEQTFGYMLRWEAKMILDLSPILNLGTNSISGTFTDKVVTNKDVRAITAADGTILFLYGFLDNQTLVITTNAQTFQNLNTKYLASHFVQ